MSSRLSIRAHGGAVEEGSVGGGTGMICNGYKGGIGTASRRLDAKDGGYTIGVLVQCNYGTRDNLRIAGINVGREIPAPEPYAFIPSDIAERGSIIVVVATDAPLLAHQLKRLAHRVTLGLGRNGSISGNGSGDIFIAFSTANSGAASRDRRGRSEDAAERFPGSGLSGDGRSDRGGHRQRHGGGTGHDRRG